MADSSLLHLIRNTSHRAGWVSLQALRVLEPLPSRQVVKLEGKDTIETRIEYKQGPEKGWAGLYWQHPDNNWGDEPGVDLTGAKRISFYARGERGGEIVEVYFRRYQ
jgi:hypothetical protein